MFSKMATAAKFKKQENIMQRTQNNRDSSHKKAKGDTICKPELISHPITSTLQHNHNHPLTFQRIGSDAKFLSGHSAALI